MNNQIVSPSPRSGHGMVYDPVNQKVILFGGGNENHIFMNDTWVYDYLTNTWTGMITSPDSTYIPSTSTSTSTSSNLSFSSSSSITSVNTTDIEIFSLEIFITFIGVSGILVWCRHKIIKLRIDFFQ